MLPILYLRGHPPTAFARPSKRCWATRHPACRPPRSRGSRRGGRPSTKAWKERDLSDRDYVYVWADGIHLSIRLKEDRLCLLVIIGVRPDGTKALIAVEDGYRESADSWSSVLRSLREDLKTGGGSVALDVVHRLQRDLRHVLDALVCD